VALGTRRAKTAACIQITIERNTYMPDCINQNPVAVGLDIGTTTISLVVIDAQTGRICACSNIPGGTAVTENLHPARRCQSAQSILEKVGGLLDGVKADYANIAAIGLTGQMHGIVYVNAQGKPVSDLYTWQDGSGEAPLVDGTTALSRLQPHCRTKLATGYGAVTHAYLTYTDALPADAVKFCTIMDCVGLMLTGRTAPLTHATNAASFGFYNLAENAFDRAAITGAGLDASFFPDCTADAACLGHWQGVPVYVAIGDNQASFRGSVREPERSVLVNIGTGSQISVLRPLADAGKYDCDVRPYDAAHVLANYSALCGGYAYALLESFVRGILTAAGMEDKPCYDLLGQLAAQALDADDPWCVQTTFSGTRAEPEKTASFTGIRRDNFTPAYLARGVLDGITDELYNGLARVLADCGELALVGSGNAVRKNAVLRTILERRFRQTLLVPAHMEEAATGCALFALQAQCPGIDTGAFLRYEG